MSRMLQLLNPETTPGRHSDLQSKFWAARILILGLIGAVSVYAVLQYLGDFILFSLAMVQLFLFFYGIGRTLAAMDDDPRVLVKAFVVACWLAALTLISIVYDLVMPDAIEELWW